MEWAGCEGDPLGYKSALVEAEQLLSTGLRMHANWRRCMRANSGAAGGPATHTNFLNHFTLPINGTPMHNIRLTL